MDQPPYTTADFQQDVQRQLVNTAIARLGETSLVWSQVAPFLDAGRAVCRDDLRLNGRVALHGLEYQGAELGPADEAYLSISARDRETGVEWLAQTHWLSDIALADEDPERVRAVIAAMERSLALVREWLEREDARAAETEQSLPSVEPGEENEAQREPPV